MNVNPAALVILLLVLVGTMYGLYGIKDPPGRI